METSSRDSVLLELNKISSCKHGHDNNEQLISHLITHMRSTDKFIGFAAKKAMYAVLMSSNQLAVHSSALTGLFGNIQAAFTHPSLYLEFSLELISKLLKRNQDNHVRLPGHHIASLLAEVYQLYFECMQRLWPRLLEFQLGAQGTISMVPFLSLTCDIVKFKLERDNCSTYQDGFIDEERAVLSCQTSIIDICAQNTLPRLLGHCITLFEVKKCLGLFTKVCGSELLHDSCSLCSTVLDSVMSSSLVRKILLNWLLLQSRSENIHCIMELFGINPVGGILVEVADNDKGLLATVVRKLTVLVVKCVSITVEGGKGIDWLCRLESVCQISTATDNYKKYENSLRDVMLEVLLDQDSVMVNAFCYCLQITKIANRKVVLSGSLICDVLNINLLFIKFLCAISYDHLVLMDYIISNETCFVDFLTSYLDYIHGNWSAFTSSHHKLQGIMKMINIKAYGIDEIGTTISLPRKRKYGYRMQLADTGAVSHTVQLEHDDRTRTTKSLVAYELSDSSEDDSVNQSILHNTMSCIIRLRLALERMLVKEIITNSQASTKLVDMIEKVETLYETE